MQADVTKDDFQDDFQWMMDWLANNNYLVTKVEMPASGKYDKITYSITYEHRAKPIEESK